MNQPLAGALTAAAADAEVEALLPQAFACIDQVLKVELQLKREVRPEDLLVQDLQLDSVTLITLVVELENTFRVALREEDAAEVKTVRELALLVARRTVEARGAAPAGDET
jgi:acyl carrier protein